MALFQRIKAPFAESESDGKPPFASGPRCAGDVLRQRREELGLDLDEVAAALKIKPAFLAALEDGQPDRLPGAAYAVGFLRSYGEHLGLDSAEVVRRFKAESAGLDAKPDLAFPMPLGERGLPGGGMLLVAVILGICGYGVWYYLATGERLRPPRVSEVPASLMPRKPPKARAEPQQNALYPAPPGSAPTPTSGALPAPVATTAAASAPSGAVPASAAASVAANPAAGAAPAPVATTAAASAPSGAVPASAKAPTTAAPANAAAPAAPPADASLGGAANPSRIVIHAVADSWIEVRDQTGAVLFDRVLKAGEDYPVPDQPGLTLVTGNAGGLAISVDGKSAPPLGPAGAVRRDIALDPQALLAKAGG